MELDWTGWAAGIIEGEGCLGLYRKYYDVKIQVESTDYFVVEKLQQLYGGDLYENRAPSKLVKYKKSWRWLVRGKENTWKVLTIIYPYLSPRRKDKADEIFEYIKNSKRGFKGGT